MPKKNSELSRIAAELQRAYNGDAWHGPCLTKILKDVPHLDAKRKPIAGAHSVWELVHHLTAWNHIVRRRFLGELVKVTPEQDWPPVKDFSSAAWQADLAALDESFRAFISALKRTAKGPNSDSVLLKTVRGKRHTMYVMLHGAVQHNLYHAGQMAILRKAI